MAIQTYADTHTHKHKHTHQTTQYLQRVQASVCVCVYVRITACVFTALKFLPRSLYGINYICHSGFILCTQFGCLQALRKTNNQINMFRPSQPIASAIRRNTLSARRSNHIERPPPNLYQDRGQQLGVQPCARVFQFNLHCNNKLISRRRSWQYLL